MNQADLQYNDLIEKINKDGVWDRGEKVRTVYADGSPAYSKSLFGLQVEFEKGILPILTSKKVFWRTALKELLLFWQMQTVQEKDFKDANVKVWQEWFNDEGNLGRSYAYQFESHRHHNREIVKIEPRLKEMHGELEDIVVGERQSVNLESDDYYVGKIIETNFNGKFIVLDVFEEGDEKLAKIQFIETNSVRIIKRNRLTSGSTKETRDYFKRELFNVGYLGDFESVKNYDKDEFKILKQKWTSMIARCYSDKDESYMKNYGDRNVFVDERWHCFENFLRDIRHLPQFFLAREDKFKNWELDKDYYGSNCYSKDTCVFLSKKENSMYTRKCKPFRINNEDGVDEILLSTVEAKCKYGLDTGDCSRYLNGKSKTKRVKGFHLEYIETNEYLYRYELSRNQVVELLNNIKNNPQSRRLLSSFWNYADVDKKELQECAWSTNWNIKNNTLDLILIQRSADIGLGVVFNWIQYYLLQCMIAHVSNLEVGRFIHQIGNLHYYDRHEKVLLEQIKKETYETPKLWINPDVKDFFDFTPNDVKILNYKSGEHIPMEVAI